MIKLKSKFKVIYYKLNDIKKKHFEVRFRADSVDDAKKIFFENIPDKLLPSQIFIVSVSKI